MSRLLSSVGVLTATGIAAPLVAASSANDPSQLNRYLRWLYLLFGLMLMLIVGVAVVVVAAAN